MSITINYCIIDTVEGSFTYSSPVLQPNGSTLFQFMQEAQRKEPEHFRFTYKEDPTLGNFITSINDLANNKAENYYWMFYKGDKLFPVGVSEFKPQSEDHIIAKYEKV